MVDRSLISPVQITGYFCSIASAVTSLCIISVYASYNHLCLYKLTMSDTCKVCDLSVVTRKAKIRCSSCERYVHGSCANMTQDDIDFVSSEKEIWRCGSCQKEHRASLRGNLPADTSGVSNEDIMNALNEQIKHLERELGKSVDACHERIGDLVKTIEQQSKALKEYEKKFDIICEENANLRGKVKNLESRLEDLEQYSRVNCIEVNGKPENKNDSPLEMIKKVGNALDVDIQEDMVDACHYLGAKQEGKNRGIIVKFVRRTTKEEILRKRKVKRNLNTTHIGLTQSPSSVIYVNESLSPARRKILNAARAFRRDYGYTFVWVNNGKVFLRKNEGERAVAVTSLEQLTELQRREANTSS